MTPAAPAERIEALDVLRGFAVLGILAVNAAAFAMPSAWTIIPSLRPPEGPADLAAWAAVQVLFEAKFYSLFSMLFGVSVFLVGGEGRDAAAGERLRRRLLWLGVFGLLHGTLIWNGDILLTYALAGVLVMLVRGWPPTSLLLLGGAAHLAFHLFAFGDPAVAGPLPAEELAGWQARAAADLAEVGGYPGGFADSLAANFREWRGRLFEVTLPSAIDLAPLMLIGLGLFKAGALRARASGVFVAVIALGLLCLALQAAITAREIASGFAFADILLTEAVWGLTAPAVTLAYAGLLLLATRGGGPLARALAPVGRMAFTNYLTQSLIMTALFYGGRGPGLFAELSHVQLWGVVVAVWAVQLAWSPLWLSRFRYGPFEWLWRSLTLGRPVAMSRSAEPALDQRTP